LPRAESSTRTLREHVEDHRKASGGAGDLDAVVGLPLREPEGVPAVDEERAVTLAQEHVARVELGDVGHDLGRQVMVAGDKALQPRNEIVIGKAGQGSEDIVLHARL
jgi:hypothetical protein